MYTLLRFSTSNSVNSNILFNEENFKVNLSLDTIYQFNSYRFTSNSKITTRDTFNFGLGLSAKIRYASQSLKNKDEFTEDFNTDFVPLKSLINNWKIFKKFNVNIFKEDIIASKYDTLNTNQQVLMILLTIYKII